MQKEKKLASPPLTQPVDDCLGLKQNGIIIVIIIIIL